MIAHPSDTFGVDCPGVTGFAPAVAAGTTNPKAGGISPFVLRINRDDGEQYMRGVTLEMPTGLIASVGAYRCVRTRRRTPAPVTPGVEGRHHGRRGGRGSQPFFTAPEHGSVYLTEALQGRAVRAVSRGARDRRAV